MISIEVNHLYDQKDVDFIIHSNNLFNNFIITIGISFTMSVNQGNPITVDCSSDSRIDGYVM